ncbi:MAG TPA: CPBP family glutamic-type intramembrane protease [Gallionella sp.]|nr:CPBP family glutamic-type intramembrane protease [Gallionella sp.]
MQRPGPGWWAWLHDTHATLVRAGAYMRHPVGVWAGPSLVLGHLRERLGSVWPAMLVHAVYNAGFGLTAWLVVGLHNVT